MLAERVAELRRVLDGDIIQSATMQLRGLSAVMLAEHNAAERRHAETLAALAAITASVDALTAALAVKPAPTKGK